MSGQSPEEIQKDIDATREQLAETVDQLAAKLDVKSQAQAKVAQVKDAATTDEGKPRPEVIAGAAVLAAALVTGLVGVVVLVRRRHS